MSFVPGNIFLLSHIITLREQIERSRSLHHRVSRKTELAEYSRCAHYSSP